MSTKRGADGAAARRTGPSARAGASAAERVAELLRTALIQGELPPGTRLSEERYAEAMAVSRNTLREAFRLLVHEGLLVHQLHSGVFVRVLDADDLRDLYWVRRTVEAAVVRALGGVTAEDADRLRADVHEAEEAARAGAWREVGTANMRFHLHLMALARSRRVEEISRRLMAEVRLAFLGVSDKRALHEPFIQRNRALLARIDSGDIVGAAEALEAYLRDSEAQVLAAYEGGCQVVQQHPRFDGPPARSRRSGRNQET